MLNKIAINIVTEVLIFIILKKVFNQILSGTKISF